MLGVQYQNGGKQEPWDLAEGRKSRNMEEKKQIGRR